MITNDHTDAALADEARTQRKSPATVEAVEGLAGATENTVEAEDTGVFGQLSVSELRENAAHLEHRVNALIGFFAALITETENQKVPAL